MPNRLADETSPYLLQHADNPVDWWPWCDEALALARERDFPILLSIGYSACHWCHVMAQECFADDQVAAVMNRHFVNIKVDREERPDLDHIYQVAHQLLAGRPGGWPLTVFLTPDAMSFFAGTYFPRTPRHRLPGFPDLLRDVAQTFARHRAGIEDQNRSLAEHLARISRPAPADGDVAAEPVLAALRKALGASWDRRHGGFGEAPKFPRTADLEFLLHCHVQGGDEGAGRMALLTLERMAEGGLYDHVGGGFFRYSTDDKWRIPHFEKMLYDNGALLGLYADAWALTGERRFREVVEGTAAWALREMRDTGGGFCAALAANSEGGEGRFYVWSRDAAQHCLPNEARKLVERHWGLDERPNFDGRWWHLQVIEPFEKSVRRAKLDEDTARGLLEASRQRLFEAREGRERPLRDDKILTGWNALMIGGLARAARIMERDDWLTAARETLACLRQTLWQDGRLLAVGSGGAGRINAFLDDYAYLLAALIELLQTDFDADELAFARELADALLGEFEDREFGGFYFTRHDHESLITRSKPIHDGSLAAGNGVAVRSLIRLGHMLGEPRYLDAAARALRAFGAVVGASPAGCASLVLALAEQVTPPALLVIQGPDARAWQRAVQRHYHPALMCLVPAGDRSRLPEVLSQQCGDVTTAWLCRGTRCDAPIRDFASLEAVIRNSVLRR
jgi:uncharacterized protein YyaL (SSP411 family)